MEVYTHITMQLYYPGTYIKNSKLVFSNIPIANIEKMVISTIPQQLGWLIIFIVI